MSKTAPSRRAASGRKENGRLSVERVCSPSLPVVLPRPAYVEPIPFSRGSLGDIVQRSQRLNSWLRDVLNDKPDSIPADTPVAPGAASKKMADVKVASNADLMQNP
jgi:hypothetical protein